MSQDEHVPSSDGPDLPPADAAASEPTVAMPQTGAPAAAATVGTPWYKKPGPWILIVLVLGAIAALLWFLLSDDDGTVTSTRVTIGRVDEAGEPLLTTLSATVVGEARAPTSFEWLLPAGASPNGAAEVTTLNDGTASFRWAPNESLEDRELWQSTITITEEIPAEAGVPEAVSQTCTFRRGTEDSESSVTLSIDIADPAEEGDPWLATYSFPNQTFIMGDVVDCSVPSGVAPTTTTSTTSTTTTTTTTTVPETTTTTVPETTAPPVETTTPPAETTTTLTPAEDSLLDVIEAREDLAALRVLLESAPDVLAALDDPDATITLFAPNDDAFEALLEGDDAPDLADPDVVIALLLAHANTTEVIPSADVLAAEEIEVMEGAPQPVDASTDPPTIGGAGIIEVDIEGINGVIHILDAVMPIQET